MKVISAPPAVLLVLEKTDQWSEFLKQLAADLLFGEEAELYCPCYLEGVVFAQIVELPDLPARLLVELMDLLAQCKGIDFAGLPLLELVVELVQFRGKLPFVGKACELSELLPSRFAVITRH